MESRFQISLRRLLVVVTLFAIALAAGVGITRLEPTGPHSFPLVLFFALLAWTSPSLAIGILFKSARVGIIVGLLLFMVSLLVPPFLVVR